MLPFFDKRVFSFLWQMDPNACMVMARPTYISGPARNGSIPPITMTDRSGQEYNTHCFTWSYISKSQRRKVENNNSPYYPYGIM